ncbi:hypothetical protein [Melittangium boletus]|uniref:Uncharacterized protein n=1 Tax=Melittangium boletus DSM 14713 TaxID=1294270 RepID=A0A250I8T3_9BACT|nr:hypothetical protein [Melittangium boletus]ATB27581.1 hypothetical protein MEBOL_001025 [Melittangium boletus DSM 14713]
MRKSILAVAFVAASAGVASAQEGSVIQQPDPSLQQPIPGGDNSLLQPQTGSTLLQQPMTGSYGLQQPMTGSYGLQQPMMGSYGLQQPMTGSYGLQQPLGSGSSFTFQTPLNDSLGTSTMTPGLSSFEQGFNQPLTIPNTPLQQSDPNSLGSQPIGVPSPSGTR